MAKEEKETAQTAPKEGAEAAPAVEVKPKAKSGLLRLIIFGVAGIVVLGGITFGVLHFVGKKNAAQTPTEQSADKSTEAAPSESSRAVAKMPAKDSTLASAAALLPDSMSDSARELENMLKAIETADQQAQNDTSLVNAPPEESNQDSTKESNWLKTEKQKLSAREADLNKRQRELEASEQKLSQKVLKIEQASAERIANVAKLYDGMEPDAVAKLMANLDDTTIVSVLPHMKQKNASLVLGLMPPQRAASITKQIINLASE